MIVFYRVNPNEKQPGEKPEGKYHYNPSNQSGKVAEIFDEDPEKNDLDKNSCD